MSSSAFEDDNKRLLLRSGAVQLATQALSRHAESKDLCTFHSVFLFFIAEDLAAALAKGVSVNEDMCIHVSGAAHAWLGCSVHFFMRVLAFLWGRSS